MYNKMKQNIEKNKTTIKGIGKRITVQTAAKTSTQYAKEIDKVG